MLLSMTGFGEARLQDDRWSVDGRGPDGQQPPPQAQRQDQRALRRPRARPRAARPRDDPPGDGPAVRSGSSGPGGPRTTGSTSSPWQSYRDQLRGPRTDGRRRSTWPALLGLPGVVEEREPAVDDPHDDWPALAAVVGEALAKLQAARAEEGRAMADELLALGRAIGDQLERIADRGPEVVAVVPEAADRAGPGAGPRARG